MWQDLCDAFQFVSSINISSYGAYVGERSSWNNSLKTYSEQECYLLLGVGFLFLFWFDFLSSMRKWDDHADLMSGLRALKETQICMTFPVASSLSVNRAEKSLSCDRCLKNVRLNKVKIFCQSEPKTKRSNSLGLEENTSA